MGIILKIDFLNYFWLLPLASVACRENRVTASLLQKQLPKSLSPHQICEYIQAIPAYFSLLFHQEDESQKAQDFADGSLEEGHSLLAQWRQIHSAHVFKSGDDSAQNMENCEDKVQHIPCLLADIKVQDYGLSIFLKLDNVNNQHSGYIKSVL